MTAPRRAPKPRSSGDETDPAGQPWRAVRKSKVARAKQLLRDPNYPSGEVIDSVARLLAKHLKPGK